jgi:predicted metal-binding membrane protein
MGLLFVGGVMNLAWVAGLTAYVLLEKIVPWLGASRLVGVVLIGWGLVLSVP